MLEWCCCRIIYNVCVSTHTLDFERTEGNCPTSCKLLRSEKIVKQSLGSQFGYRLGFVVIERKGTILLKTFHCTRCLHQCVSHRAVFSRYSDQQAKRATVLHKRDRERRAAVRVQSRWRGRKGRLAYHLIQQAKKLQQEEDETDYDPANWIRGWDEEAKLHYYINIKTGRQVLRV